MTTYEDEAMENHDTDGIKRLPNGSVDFDYYAARARELKIETWRAIGRRIANAVSRLFATEQPPRAKRLSPTRAY
jgi:hypothetical protein